VQPLTGNNGVKMAAKKAKAVKDLTITIRLEPEDEKKLKDLAQLIESKSGIEVTKSWVLRESMKVAHDIIKKKYEGM
jgi:uncharacterized protein (DUF1778 family)